MGGSPRLNRLDKKFMNRLRNTRYKVKNFPSVGYCGTLMLEVTEKVITSGQLRQGMGYSAMHYHALESFKSLSVSILTIVFLVATAATIPAQTTTQQRKATPKGKAKTDTSNSDPAAVNYYADAASYQNNGAFQLAIEEWKKLLRDHAKDPLASKARHYMGVCFMQLEKPDYQAAIGAFSAALQDTKLEVREESLLNLGWCTFTLARNATPESEEQVKLLRDSREHLTRFLSTYRDGNYVDQALFYLGEIEYSLAARDKAIGYYEQLLRNKSLLSSSLRPDARYALGVALEEQKEDARAKEAFETFLKDHANHRLTHEVRLRLADIFLRENKPADAERIFRQLAETKDNASADYALLRQAYALSQQDKFADAAKLYQQLIEKFPDSKHAKQAGLSAGQMHFRLGQWDPAGKQFEKILTAKDAQAAEAAHWLNLVLMRQGKPQEAAAMLEPALKWAAETPSSLTLRMDLADALYEIPARIEEAKKKYEEIATANPKNPLAPRAAYNAAFASLQTGKLDDARRWSEVFLKNYPDDPLRNDVAYVAAEALLQQAQHEASAEAYSQLIKAAPTSAAVPMWNLRLAMARYLGGKYQVAINVLQSQLASFKEPRQKAEAQFIMGACYLFLSDVPKAVEQLQASHQTSNSWSQADEVLLLLSQAQQRQQQPDAAIATLDRLLTQYPNSRLKPQVEFRVGQIAAGKGKHADAIERYKRVIANPQAKNLHDYAHYGIAWCNMQQEKFDAALEALKPLLGEARTGTINAEAALAQGVCFRKLGKIDEARKSLEGYLESKPTGVSLGNGLYELGLTLAEKGAHDEAVKVFERILTEVADYAALDKVLLELGWAWTEKKDAKKATKYFQQLVDKYPQSELFAEASYQLGQEQYAAEKYTEAVSIYTSVVSKTQDPELQEKAHYKLGWSHFQLNQFKTAAEQFKKQAEKFPKGPLVADAQFMQAECLFKEDKFDEALSGYQQARQTIESSPSSQASDQVKSLVYLHGAQCLREAKKWPECEQWLKQLISRFPKSAYMSTILYELGYCKEKQNQLQEALKHYAEAASNYRDEAAARARFMMGEVYFSQRDFAKAIPEFQRVMFGFGGEKAPEEIKKWQARSAFEAGRCSDVLIQDLKGGSREKSIGTAKEFYKFVIDNHPGHELAKQAQARLQELSQLR